MWWGAPQLDLKSVLRNTTNMFFAREASRLAGFKKPWMLNHLEREGIFIPETEREHRHGVRRTYTFRDLIVLRAINRLLELGARPKRISDAIHQFSTACPDVMGDVTMTGLLVKFARESGHFLVTPDQVLYCRSKDEIIDLIGKGQLAFSFMIDNALSTMPSIKAAAELHALPKGKRRDTRIFDEIIKKYAI
jgi:DNA-binding transcriptional MerR regulator